MIFLILAGYYFCGFVAGLAAYWALSPRVEPPRPNGHHATRDSESDHSSPLDWERYTIYPLTYD